MKKEVLGDETNNTDYEETVDPVSVDIAIEDLSDLISETELEPCTKEEAQLISKGTAVYIAADRSPEADAKILDGAICCSNALPQDINHFPGLEQQRFLALHFWTNSNGSAVGFCLGRLSRRQLEGRDKKQTGPKLPSPSAWEWIKDE